MVIRDDRGKTRRTSPPALPISYDLAPDRVLYDCPQCGHSHFVTVDDCPDAEEAARETAMIGRET